MADVIDFVAYRDAKAKADMWDRWERDMARQLIDHGIVALPPSYSYDSLPCDCEPPYNTNGAYTIILQPPDYSKKP